MGCDSIETLVLNVDSNFVITFKDEDGTILEQATWKYEQLPQYTGTTPTKEGNVQYSYDFAGWDKPIAIVTEDATYTAIFYQRVNVYTLTLMCDNEQGSITGAGEYEYNSEISIEAVPELGWAFSEWSDGYTENPRTIILTQDSTLSAVFRQLTLEEVISVASGEYDALIEWHPVLFGLFYKLFVYYDAAHIQLHAVLTFDAVGNLIFVDYIHHSPRRGLAQKETSGSFSYQVTDLMPGSTYYYVLQALDADGESVLDTTEGSFSTTGTATALDTVDGGNDLYEKVFRDGQIYILRGDKTYTLQGQEVK